jgi:hypothetical protein
MFTSLNFQQSDIQASAVGIQARMTGVVREPMGQLLRSWPLGPSSMPSSRSQLPKREMVPKTHLPGSPVSKDEEVPACLPSTSPQDDKWRSTVLGLWASR